MALNYTCFDKILNEVAYHLTQFKSKHFGSIQNCVFCHGQSKSRLKTSQQNVLENLYNIIEVMTEFIAVNTKKSIQLTKALVFNFFS